MKEEVGAARTGTRAFAVSATTDLEPMSGLVDEARSHLDYVDIRASFEVVAGDHLFEGVSFSRRTFSVKRVAFNTRTEQWEEPDVSRPGSPESPFRMRIQLSGFVLELEFQAIPAPASRSRTDLSCFEIVTISEPNQVALNKVVRAFIAGLLPTVDDLSRHNDAETDLPASTEAAADAGGNRWRSMALLGLSIIVLVAAVAYGGLAVYSKVSVVNSEYATLTAPRLDLLSPVRARVASVAATYQEAVARDQVLFQLESAEIEAGILSTQAKIAYYDALDADPALRGGEMVRLAGTPPDSLTPVAVDARMARHARSFELGTLKSLELRKASLTVYSPCACDVIWVVDSGTSVAEGDRVMTLARTGIDDLRVEALVKHARAIGVRTGQPAFVHFPELDATLTARVESVRLDGDLPPRAGFPEWLRKDPTLATLVLRLEQRPSRVALGAPLEVAIPR